MVLKKLHLQTPHTSACRRQPSPIKQLGASAAQQVSLRATHAAESAAPAHTRAHPLRCLGKPYFSCNKTTACREGLCDGPNSECLAHPCSSWELLWYAHSCDALCSSLAAL